MSVKQKCNNALIMLFYKFIDGSKIIDEFGNVFRWSDLNSNHREVNRQYYPTEQLRQSNAIKKNDSTHKA